MFAAAVSVRILGIVSAMPLGPDAVGPNDDGSCSARSSVILLANLTPSTKRSPYCSKTKLSLANKSCTSSL